ncbi:MAG: hypothetical protein IPK63_23130 [Candidatus Competibacteraceae bacterium]|nr:hypothetical protein [Candidatus Competibacteraceae bacterium]
MSQRKKRAAELHHLLAERFPKAFPADYNDLLPLKIGVEADIIGRLGSLGEQIDPSLLRRVMANHTARAGYQLAVLHRPGGHRHDLDGNPVDPLDARARAEAIRLLAEHRQRHKEASDRLKQHNALKKREQNAKAARIAERERQIAQKQHCREKNKSNQLIDPEQKTVLERGRKTEERSDAAPSLPAVIFRKRRRIEPT